MYETVSTHELDAVTIEGTEAEIYPVGYHLGTDESRSNVWEFDEGDSGRLHRQTEQEELYYVVEGSVNFEIGDDDLTVEIEVLRDRLHREGVHIDREME